MAKLFLGRMFSPAHKPRASSQLKSSMWLRRSLSKSFSTKRLNKALVAGTIFDSGYSAEATTWSNRNRASNGQNKNTPAVRVQSRRPGFSDNVLASATAIESRSGISPTPGGRPRNDGEKRGEVVPDPVACGTLAHPVANGPVTYRKAIGNLRQRPRVGEDRPEGLVAAMPRVGRLEKEALVDLAVHDNLPATCHPFSLPRSPI